MAVAPTEAQALEVRLLAGEAYYYRLRETLPEGFQRSEFLLEHGAIDLIIDRRDQRERIANLLRLFLKVPPAAA